MFLTLKNKFYRNFLKYLAFLFKKNYKLYTICIILILLICLGIYNYNYNKINIENIENIKIKGKVDLSDYNLREQDGADEGKKKAGVYRLKSEKKRKIQKLNTQNFSKSKPLQPFNSLNIKETFDSARILEGATNLGLKNKVVTNRDTDTKNLLTDLKKSKINKSKTLDQYIEENNN
jgi:hypothetical protein